MSYIENALVIHRVGSKEELERIGVIGDSVIHRVGSKEAQHQPSFFQ